MNWLNEVNTNTIEICESEEPLSDKSISEINFANVCRWVAKGVHSPVTTSADINMQWR